MKTNKNLSVPVVNESLVSLILGVVIVILVGLLAFNYFRNNRPSQISENDIPAEQETTDGEITEATSTISLPATHVVKAGENLWNIAEKYYSSGFNYVDIAKENKLSDASQIEVGQKLVIPNVPSYSPNRLSSITGSSYTVVKSDSLWTIALRAYGDPYRWVEIAKVNKLTNADTIHAGNVLSIPR